MHGVIAVQANEVGVPTFLPVKIPFKEATVQGEDDRNEFQEMY
jgi:hypothetical protein